MKDDAISRQVAIASIKMLYPDMPIVDFMGARRKWREKCASYIECENILKALPPALSSETVTEFADKCRECGSMLGRQMKQNMHFDGMTNGEVLMSLYPNLRYIIQNGRVVTTIGTASSFDLDWWNRPYKSEIAPREDTE